MCIVSSVTLGDNGLRHWFFVNDLLVLFFSRGLNKVMAFGL